MDNEFKNNIEIELDNLKRLITEMHDLIIKINAEPDFITTRAAGSILHDFYCGIEKIFERIAINIDKHIPKGEDWHTKLLLQMAEPKKSRKAIIDSVFLQELKEYLRFRHLFRNIYGFVLKWEKIKPLCARLDDIFDKLKRSLDELLK